MSCMELEPLMTVADVMRVTRLSKAMVYRLKSEGILPPVKLPGCSKVLFAPPRRATLPGSRTSYKPVGVCLIVRCADVRLFLAAHPEHTDAYDPAWDG